MSGVDRVKLEQLYWDEAARDPEVDTKFICDIPTEKCLADLLPGRPVGNILDLGCGVGRLTIPMAKIHSSALVIGLDISREMLNIANKRSRGTRNVSYIQGNGRMIPRWLGKFDYAYTMVTFQHLPEEAVEKYLREVYRSLKPGGTFKFQIVTRADDGPFSNPMTAVKAVMRALEVGFVQTFVKDPWIHPDWALIKVAKPL